MKILLVNADYDSKYYSLGIAYLKGFLKQHYPTIKTVSADLKTIDKVLEPDFDYICVSVLTHCMPEVYQLMLRIRHQFPNTKFVAGGLHTTAMPQQMLDIGFDFAVKGPGETGLMTILDDKNAEPIIQGVYRPIDYFPDFLDQTPRKTHVMPLITSFGCPFSCNFCSCGNVWNKRVYFEDVDFCIKTIRHLLAQHNYKRIFVWDDNFLLRKSRVKAFCEEYKKTTDLPWQAYSRGELVTEELCHIIRDANCRQLRMGIESGSDTILKGVLKGMTVETNEKAIRIQHDCDLNVHGYFLCGLPGETDQTILETKEFIRRNRFESWQVNIPLLYPDTDLHRIALENGFDNSCYLTEKPKYFTYEHPAEKLEQWRAEIKDLLTQRYRIIL